MRQKLSMFVKKQRLMTSVYLRRDLKSFAREAACVNGQPLSRYIESLLIGELVVTNCTPASDTIWASTLDSQKFSPKHQTPNTKN
jgi:hypothetical protein